MKNILVICGPTASGKTSLALKIANTLLHRHSGLDPESRKFPSFVHILSVDSRQIYKDLDIITGKDIPSDLPPNIKFFGLDLAEPSEVFNLSDFVNYAGKVIQDSLSKNIPLIIVGGTGLYTKAITSNFLNVNVPPDPVLRKTLEKLDLDGLKKRLLKINPQKFNSLNNSDINNPRRLIRAIEITQSLSPKESPRQVLLQGDSLLDRNNLPTFHWVGLRQDKLTQAEKIRQRVLSRLEQGAIAEVNDLRKKYPNQKLPLFSSLGVKEIVQYLDQKISLEELVVLWASAEADYARRQMVWFQKQSQIIWYDINSCPNLVTKLTKTIF